MPRPRIRRWQASVYDSDLQEQEDGQYVLYADHYAVVAAARELVKAANRMHSGAGLQAWGSLRRATKDLEDIL